MRPLLIAEKPSLIRDIEKMSLPFTIDFIKHHRALIKGALGKNLIVADWLEFVWGEKEY